MDLTFAVLLASADPSQRITSWVAFIVIGFVIGLLARWLTPGSHKLGCITTILLGVAGSFLAGVVTRELWAAEPGFIASVIGAVVVLLVWGLLFGGKRR